MIGADEIEQFRAGEPARVIAEGINRLGDAAAMQFLLINFTPRFSRERQPQEAQTVGRGGRGAARLEWGLGGGNEEEPIQAQFLAGGLRHEQVPEMDRIKRTAE